MDPKKRKQIRLIAALGAASIGLPLSLLFPGAATKRQKAPFMGVNFAHRGLHSRDKSVPENSLAAFELAASAGYGIELDVQLSKDGQVVVFHDDTLDRVCGVHGRVDAFDYSQLREMKLCGSEQTIPLFTEVLQTIRGRGSWSSRPGRATGSCAKKPTPSSPNTAAMCASRALTR